MGCRKWVYAGLLWAARRRYGLPKVGIRGAAVGRRCRGERPESGTIPNRQERRARGFLDRKSTRLNSSHLVISYAVFCLKKKKTRKVHECRCDRLYIGQIH